MGLGSVVKANCHIAPLRKVEAGEVIFSTRRPIEGVDSRQLEDGLSILRNETNPELAHQLAALRRDLIGG